MRTCVPQVPTVQFHAPEFSSPESVPLNTKQILLHTGQPTGVGCQQYEIVSEPCPNRQSLGCNSRRWASSPGPSLGVQWEAISGHVGTRVKHAIGRWIGRLCNGPNPGGACESWSAWHGLDGAARPTARPAFWALYGRRFLSIDKVQPLGTPPRHVAESRHQPD